MPADMNDEIRQLMIRLDEKLGYIVSRVEAHGEFIDGNGQPGAKARLLLLEADGSRRSRATWIALTAGVTAIVSQVAKWFTQGR